jgi:hypothetical protein
MDTIPGCVEELSCNRRVGRIKAGFWCRGPRIGLEMQRRLQQAATQGTRALIVRAGDLFGPRGTGSSWFTAAFSRTGNWWLRCTLLVNTFGTSNFLRTRQNARAIKTIASAENTAFVELPTVTVEAP